MRQLKKPVYSYQSFKSFRVVDGDTVIADIDFGLDTIRKDIYIRLDGTDAPEDKYAAGMLVTKIIAAMIHRSRRLEILSKSVMEGRGRLMGEVIIDEGSLGQILLDWGLAKPCTTKRPEWTEQELIRCMNNAIEFSVKENLDMTLPNVII